MGAGVTLRDVAERAGVSLATASKVMNERADVRSETRDAVRRAARDLGYAHRRRAGAAGNSLLIVFDTLSSPYSLQILQGAVAAARRMGVDLAVSSLEDQPVGEQGLLSRRWFREASERGHRAVIAVTVPLTQREVRIARACSMPLLVVDPAAPDSTLVGRDGPVRCSATNWAGGRSAAQHLLELGHRRIGMLVGPEASAPGRERADGCRSALQQAGAPLDEDLVDGGAFEFEAGREAALRLLEREDRPTALFAASDTLALGALRAAHELGIRVPEQLSIVGFDDTLASQWTSPKLTVVHQPLEAMGQVAVERAIALAADPGSFAHPFQLETHLVVRESTGPAPADA